MRKVAILVVGTAISALATSAASALPTCADLGTDPANGLAGNPQVSALTAVLTPVGPGVTVPYCQINFTFSSESGPAFGYYTSGAGASEHIKLRIGLPASTADGGVQGAWNGKTRDSGGGGYAGNVGGVTGSTNLGYVGTSTDTGHNTAQDGPGGAFALNPDGTLNQGLIKDFAGDGIHQQGVWGVALAKTYYGTDPTRKYWVGCSTGGRQGHYLAQNYPAHYDGILAGANAFNWDRFIAAELWPAIVMKDTAGGPIPGAKLTFATNKAIAACDGLDGIVDGVMEEPRACTYSAAGDPTAICIANGGTSADPNCLTPAQASAVDKIWNGPVDAQGRQAWYGLERGTPLGGLAGTNPFSIATDHFRYWIHQNAAFDWHTVTEASFFTDYLTSIQKFNTSIGTDDNLVQFRAKGGKMITYHGLWDSLIFPRGTAHYYNNIPGGISNTQKYYRHFMYPNAGHCGGAGINGTDQFNALVNWVENGVAPEVFIAQHSATRSRKVCMYPNVQVYNGSGSTDDHNNFTCVTKAKDELIDTLTINAPYETAINNQPPS